MTIQEKIDRELRGFRIGGGGHDDNYSESPVLQEKELCVMEFVTYALHGIDGLQTWGWKPPCVSGVITYFLVGMNDSSWGTDEKRKRLVKAVAPHVVGTAPTYSRGGYVHTKTSDPEYRKAERARRGLIWNSPLIERVDLDFAVTTEDLMDLSPRPNTTVQQLADLVIQMAEVKKFNVT